MEVEFKQNDKTVFEDLQVGDWFSHEFGVEAVYMKTDQRESGVGTSICPNGTRRVTNKDAQVYRRYFKMVEI